MCQSGLKTWARIAGTGQADPRNKTQGKAGPLFDEQQTWARKISMILSVRIRRGLHRSRIEGGPPPLHALLDQRAPTQNGRGFGYVELVRPGSGRNEIEEKACLPPYLFR